MKKSNIILIAFTALAAGLAAGYLLFGKPDKHAPGAAHGGEQMETAPTPEASMDWTCSMHPQIRQDEPGDCPICGMDLIPLDESVSDDPLVLEMTHEAVKLANIETTVVGAKGSATKSFSLSGKIAADERLAASQVAHVPGRIEKLFVTFTGEQVTQGQDLAVLYSPELVTAQRELLEALDFQDVNPGLVDAARKKLAYWKIPEAEIRLIEQSGQIRETFTLYADATGTVTSRKVAVGDYVSQGDVLFEIVSLDRVWVLFDAYEEDLASIGIGDRIEFTTPAVPNRVFSTRITFIDPVIDPVTRVASLRGEISNRGGILKPEMFVRGTLRAGVKVGEHLLVPASAVLWTGQRSVVYVKMPGTNIPAFQFREVKLGNKVGEDYMIEEGLEPGDEVVTYGNFAIDAAAQLNNRMSMMNRDIGLKGSDAQEQYPDFRESTPVAFREQLANVTESYFELKDALVSTDPVGARKAATRLLANIPGVDMKLVEGDAHMYWMEQSEALHAHTAKIADTDDVEDQRTQFDFLSQVLIQTVKAFGVQGDTFYIQHCPMAFDNDGADWISPEEEIRNPYFGDKMLKCGFVQDTVTSEGSSASE